MEDQTCEDDDKLFLPLKVNLSFTSSGKSESLVTHRFRVAIARDREAGDDYVGSDDPSVNVHIPPFTPAL